MPKIIFKELTLNDQAYIIKYNHRDTFYLRIKREGKKYTNVSLKTEDLEVAKKNALTTYLKTAAEPPKSRTRRFGFDAACDEFLKEKGQEVFRKQLTAGSHHTYCQRMYHRIIPFAKFAGIKSLGEIEKKTFTGYKDYYLDVKTKGKWKSAASGLAPSTINSDINTLNEFLKWCCRKEYLDPRKVGEIPKAKDQKNYREESNPAFFPDEFARMKDVLYKFDQKCKDDEDKWKKRWFIHYILFQYGLGSRPHESAKIRYGDCRVEKRPDGKLKGIVEIPADTKRGRRTAIMNGNTLRKVQSHLRKGIDIRNKQIELMNKRLVEEFRHMTTERLVRKYRSVNPETRQIDLLHSVCVDDYLLMNPFLKGRKVYHSEHIRGWWNCVLAECNFKERYTLYSLRSTHITHALLKGMNVRIVAENCGTSQNEIETTYQRLNNLLNIDQLGFFKDNVVETFVDEG